jgi:hypothetical protein
MPLISKISARSGTSTKGARVQNIVNDGKDGIARKRPALVYSNGYGGIGNGLMDTPNGLFGAWDNSGIVDEAGTAHIVGSGVLTSLIVAGWSNLYITGMSDDGQTCSGYGTKAAVGIRAVKLTKTTLTELTYPSGVTGETYAYGISGDGLTIVGSGYVTATGIYRAYKWVDSTATQVAVANISDTEGGAYGASYDGSSICGYVNRAGVKTGFIYSGGAVSYKALGGIYTSDVRFYCISSNGQYVGGRARDPSTAQQHPIIYDGTTTTAVFTGASGVVNGLSHDGEYCCGIPSAGDDGFFYKKTGAVLTYLDSGTTTILPYAISRYGNAVVGEAVTPAGTVSMFRWTEVGGFENLGRIAETGTATGAASGYTTPKSGGCSAMGTTIAVTQFNVATRTPAFWTPTA